MAEGQITIRIPGASPPIPEVVIECYLDDEFYSLGVEGLSQVAGRSAAGTALIVGAATTSAVITVTGVLPEEDALRLGAIARWSSREYLAERDGHLEMDCEVEYTDPEPAPHSKTLVQTLITSYGYEYGYPRLNVSLTLPTDYRKRRGVAGGVLNSLVQFAATEV